VHVLDVKLRSDQVRQARLRWSLRAVSVILGMGCGLFVLWRAGDWALNRLVYQNPAFAISDVDAKTDGVISEPQLRRWTNVQVGENLLALDLARVQKNLRRIPFFASVSVERILPKTLRVRVTEREAVARVQVPYPRPGGGPDVRVFHLDPGGFVMPPIDPRLRATPGGPAEDALPELAGLKLTDLQVGRRLVAAQVTAGLQLISDFACSPMAGLVDLRRIDLSAPEVLVVTTGQGSEVTFALQDLDRQLRRWREIHDKLQQKKSRLVSLDLAVPNNIPMRYLDGDPLPVPAPKPPKPLRSKKRHV
jgi:cell division septal protein FtsQ